MTLRLLYVIDSLAPGGTETSLAAMAPGLVTAGIDLHVLSLKPRLDLADQITGGGGTVHWSARIPGRGNNVRAVVRVARDTRPALIHTTLFEADIAGRIAAQFLGIRSSTSLVSEAYSPSHFAEGKRLKLHAAQAVDRLTVRPTTRFHAVSHAVAESVGPRLGIVPDMIRVIPRGRDPKKYPFRPAATRHEVRTQFGVRDTTPLVLAVGRLEQAKGYQYLIEALPRVASLHPHVVLLIAGSEGRASRALRAQAAATTLDIRFLGHRTDVASLMAAADAICAPSDREGIPGALIEALAVGCPVVASDIGPNREALGNPGEAAGVLVAPRDPSALAGGLLEILSYQAKWADLAARGRHRFESHFALKPITEQMAAFFESAAVDARRT